LVAVVTVTTLSTTPPPEILLLSLLTTLSTNGVRMANSMAAYDTAIDEDAPGLPISVPDSGDTGEGGRLKMIIQLVKRSLGVKDLAAMFVSFSL
jgi:hypothetical protein